MAKPVPEWLPRVMDMRRSEAVLIDACNPLDSIRWNLRKLEGKFRCKRISDTQVRIERVG